MSDCPTPQRRDQLREARKALFKLPRNEWYELAGHPTVYYELRDYREHPLGKEEGIKTARSDINFMFKAFETGQVSLEAPCGPNMLSADPTSCNMHQAPAHAANACNDPQCSTSARNDAKEHAACKQEASLKLSQEQASSTELCMLLADSPAQRPEDIPG